MKNELLTIEDLKSKLLEAEEEKKALFKVISHDIRSPFNKLFALIGLLKMSADQLNAEQKGYLETMELVISDSLWRMRNLLDLKAIENEGVTTIFENVDLAKLIEKSVKGFTPALDRKKIKVNVNTVPAILETDKLSCLRILDQLISNAINFSPRESTIQIKLIPLDEAFNIDITDGGYGIADNEQLRLFKKFSVLSSRTTGGESTTGLGLYIAQWLAANIGGKISYNNKSGSTFTLRLNVSQLA